MRTQIVINNTQIDLLKEVSLNITKQLVDIQSPEKRKTDRTLTIDIPGSKANDLLFSYIFEVNIDLGADDSSQLAPHFNPNKKAKVSILIDSITQLKGYCQLTDIVVNQNNKVVYKIVCYGELGDLFAQIKNQTDSNGSPIKGELTDLDFSEFDHTFNRGVIANSWDTEITENGGGVPFELGKGYVYPMIDYGAERRRYKKGLIPGDLWSAAEFRPAIYTKQYIDKIFEAAGYTYTSDFFDSEFFKRLIVPFNSDKFKLDNDEVESRLFYAVRSTSSYSSGFFNSLSNIASASPVVFNNETTPYFDNGSNYDNSTGKFIPTKKGRYSFETKITAKLHYDDGSNDIDLFFAGINFRLYFSLIHKSGSTYTEVADAWADTNFGVLTTIGSGDLSGEFYLTLVTNDLRMEVGDEFFVAAKNIQAPIQNSSSGNLQTGWTIQTQATTESYFANAIPNPEVIEDDTVVMNQCIPTDVKQQDFLSSIIKAFNLYVEPNPEKENDLFIEPREDYYTGQSVDWTKKLDLSKDFTISPMAALDANEYHFKYADDEDYLNKTYDSVFGRTYGDHKLKIDNDFVKKTKKIELIFAATPSYKKLYSRTTRVVPAIQFFDKDGKVSPKTSKIRLLYYGGMKACEPWYLDAYNYVPEGFVEYPYSGHLDDPYDSTIDLNFAPPAEVYYQTTANKPLNYTNQNLYAKYWYAQMRELTDKNSKIVEGWFYLTPSDIEGLSFRKYYFIKDAYYRLLKVENYDPVFSKVTKCKFLKVQEFDAPLLNRGGLNGGVGTFGTTDTTYNVPGIGGTAAPAGSPANGPTIVTGWDNTVDETAASVLLTGTGNYINGFSEYITVIGGGGNIVGAGFDNVTLINSSGITVAESDVLYLNNQKYFPLLMGDTVSVVADDSPYTLTSATNTLFCNTIDNDITVNLPSAIGLAGKAFEVMKTDDSGNEVILSAYASETINGSATYSLTAAYDRVKVVSDGAAWYIF